MRQEKPQFTADTEIPTPIKNLDLVRERRRQLVDSTVKLFIEYGYHKTTTRMIAKASGFSIGSLYEYVSSKEDLLFLVCDAIHEELIKTLSRTLSCNGNGKRLLSEVLRQYFIVCDRMADHILLMYQVTQFLPEKHKKRVLKKEIDITQIFIRALTKVSGKDGAPAMDDRMIGLVAHDISVLGQMWAFRRWHIQKAFTINDYIEYQTTFIWNIIHKGLKSCILESSTVLSNQAGRRCY